MDEGELFSFRVVRGSSVVPLQKWTAVEVNTEMTVADVFRQLKVADDAVTDDELICFVSKTTADKCSQSVEVAATQRVTRLCRFGYFITIQLPERQTSASALSQTNAFSALMLGAKAASAVKLPAKHNGDDIRGDRLLENAIVDWLESKNLGFRHGLEASVGKSFVRKLRSVLFELPHERAERLKQKSCKVPVLFAPLLTTEYNDPTKHGHKRLPPLSKVLLSDMSSTCLELSSIPALQVPSWTEVRENLRVLSKSLLKYVEYLDAQTASANKLHESVVAARSVDTAKNSSLVRYAARVRTAEKCRQYAKVESALRELEPYEGPVQLNDMLPSNRDTRYRFMHNLELPFPYEIYSYDPGSNIGCLWWAWKVPVDSEETDSTRSLQLVKQCEKDAPTFATRAMRRDFINRYQMVTDCSAAVLRNMYQYVSGDVSQAPCNISKDVQQRLSVALDAQDPDIVFDLRHLNEGRQSQYDQFWEECRKFIEDQALAAADDRRHGQVVHMAAAISVRDLIEQVAKRLPEDCPIPSESWVRLQFCPKNALYSSAVNYTGKLDIKHMVQARQLSHDHPDGHYAAAIFRYLKEFAAKFRNICSLVCLDDKHMLKVGEPDFPVAAVDRGKRVLVAKDTALSVGDHDFTKVKIVPSVALVVEVPEAVSDSFYNGQVVVTLKEAAFQPSSAIRHSAELLSTLKVCQVNGIISPVLALYTDGGPDHNVTFASVQLSLIALFKRMQLDYLIAVRTCPYQSYKNPVERVMSLVNLALQSVGMMRAQMPDDMERLIKSANSMKTVREAADKASGLKDALLQSVQPTKDLLCEFLQRVPLHGKKFKSQPAASDDEIAKLVEELRDIDPEVSLAKNKAQLAKLPKFQEFVEHCCVSQHYFFLIKKCGSRECVICGPPTLADEKFNLLHTFPCPEPAGEHYKSFDDVWGKDTSPEHRPSAKRAAANTMSMRTFPASAISTRKEKVRLSVLCTECIKPRCIFSESRLANDDLIKLREALEEVDYVCGSPLLQESHPLFAKVVVRAGLTCQDDVSAVYFSCKKFPNVCYACGSEDPEAVPAAIKATSQAANPVCAACAAAGKAVRSRKRGTKRKHGQDE